MGLETAGLLSHFMKQGASEEEAGRLEFLTDMTFGKRGKSLMTTGTAQGFGGIGGTSRRVGSTGGGGGNSSSSSQVPRRQAGRVS